VGEKKLSVKKAKVGEIKSFGIEAAKGGNDENDLK